MADDVQTRSAIPATLGVCPACTYSLKVLPDPPCCPECANPINPAECALIGHAVRDDLVQVVPPALVWLPITLLIVFSFYFPWPGGITLFQSMVVDYWPIVGLALLPIVWRWLAPHVTLLRVTANGIERTQRSQLSPSLLLLMLFTLSIVAIVHIGPSPLVVLSILGAFWWYEPAAGGGPSSSVTWLDIDELALKPKGSSTALLYVRKAGDARAKLVAGLPVESPEHRAAVSALIHRYHAAARLTEEDDPAAHEQKVEAVRQYLEPYVPVDELGEVRPPRSAD